MAVWDRYKSKTSSFEVKSYIGANFQIRFFCDDTTAVIYAAKPPVCKLKLTPTVQFINTDIAWDISQSISSTGTVDTYDIAWGGTTDDGDESGTAFSGAKTGTIQYTTAGTYTVTASVTDTLGVRSTQQTQQVKIIETDDFVNLKTLYTGTTNGGIFRLEPDAEQTAINTGLTGDNLKIRAVRMHPATKSLPTSQHHLWACTAAGIVFSTDGGNSWTLKPKADLGTPINTAGDGPAPATADLDQIDLCFDPQDQLRVYFLRTTATRAWLYLTSDYGTTWSNTQIDTSP